MARARGANAVMNAAFETAYGTPPVAGYTRLPFVSADLGATRGLIESDLLGQGRKPYDPTLDVSNDDGDVVVPVDTRAFGAWLKLLLGAPATDAIGLPAGFQRHLFMSGATTLPSMAIEIGHPEVPSFSTNYGARANTLRIDMRRSGLLNATLGLIAKGETIALNASSVANPATYPDGISRFAQARGQILRDGVQLANIVSADFSFSNAHDKVETIRPDGEIEDADPGMPMASGTIAARFADNNLLNLATSGAPTILNFGWTIGNFSLYFAFKRVFLPRVKRPITGPGGIQASFNWQGASAIDPLMQVELINDQPSY